MSPRKITDTTDCECCVVGGCISGTKFEPFPVEDRDNTQCNDYVTATTTAAMKTGMYNCTGATDDGGEISWSGGSQSWDGSRGEECFGVVQFSFEAYIQKNDSVSCTGKSWGGRAGCRITCCYIDAP
jgi:hypothetical protein